MSNKNRTLARAARRQQRLHSALDALDIVRENLEVFDVWTIFRDLSNLSMTSHRFKNILANQQIILKHVVQKNQGNPVLANHWMHNMLQNDCVFDIVMSANLGRERDILDLLLEHQNKWSIHVYKTCLHIVETHPQGPMVLLIEDIRHGYWGLNDYEANTPTKIEAFFDAMDAHGSNWVDNYLFEYDFSSGHINLIGYLMQRPRISVLFLNMLARRYDLNRIMQTKMFDEYNEVFVTPLSLALSVGIRLPKDCRTAVLEFALSESDMNNPIHEFPVFQLMEKTNFIHENIIRRLYDSCSNYDWTTQKEVSFESDVKTWANAWEYSQMLLYHEVVPEKRRFLIAIKTWLESLGARAAPLVHAQLQD
jgi:hypothetical protein